MSLLIKAAVFGGLAYAITRAIRNPAVKEFLAEGQDALSRSGPSHSSMSKSSMKSELHPDESLWPTQPQQANTGPSS